MITVVITLRVKDDVNPIALASPLPEVGVPLLPGDGDFGFDL